MDTLTESIACINAILESSGRGAESTTLLLAGSHAYGLSTPRSDIDIRGFALPTRDELLDMRDFEQVDLHSVDAVIYSLRKFVKLALDCNPNIIELLGVSERCIITSSSEYAELRENVDRFVSKRCVRTFGGYATAQLRRIENALDRENPARTLDNAKRSADAVIAAAGDRYPSLATSSLALVCGADALAISGTLDRVAPSELRSLANDVNEAVKNADALLARNRKRESAKLAKHASHLVRLLRMGREMLETGAVNTDRSMIDADELRELKAGKWLGESADGERCYDDAFWKLVRSEEARLRDAAERSRLPDEPDVDWATSFVRNAHARVLGI